MKCNRCSSVMVYEHFYGNSQHSSWDKFEGWRCTGCGDILDPVILENRRCNKPVKKAPHRGYTIYGMERRENHGGGDA